MVFFRRKRGPDLGRYEAPAAVDPTPIERVVDEGLMIATTAVRMHVKNELIVQGLRDDRAYDPEALAEVAAAEFEKLAGQSDGLARNQHTARDIRLAHDIAHAMLSASANADLLAVIVEQAREEAWREISGVVATTLAARAVDPTRDPDYAEQREERLRALVQVDLATLNENARFDY